MIQGKDEHFGKLRISFLMSTLTLEAESIAFCVGSALSIVDSGDYTFPYLASWASGKDTKELKDSLERIRSASDEMITAIDHSLQKQTNREKQKFRDEGR